MAFLNHEKEHNKMIKNEIRIEITLKGILGFYFHPFKDINLENGC